MGFDIGGTKTEVAVLDRVGGMVHRRREATPREYDELVALVRTLVMDAERALGRACTVGVGAPGSPNPATGLHRGSNLTAMNGKPFQADISAAIGRPVRVSNDANCMALSEAMDGAARPGPSATAGGPHVVFGVIIGTGVGGGVVVDGRVVEGCQGIAGEWGHNPMPRESAEPLPGAASCYCGRRDCLEMYLSGPALERRYRVATGCDARADELAGRAAAGDAQATALLAWHARALASALGTVVNVLDPHVIVLAGGLSNFPGLADTVRAALPPFIFGDGCHTSIVQAKHGDASGVRGAAWLGQSAQPPRSGVVGC